MTKLWRSWPWLAQVLIVNRFALTTPVLLHVSQAPAEVISEKDAESGPLWKCSAMPTKHAKVGGSRCPAVSVLAQVKRLSAAS